MVLYLAQSGLSKSAVLSMCGSRKFYEKGSYFENIFFFDEGREDPSTTKSGPLSARQRNAIKWRFAGVPMMAQH